MEENLKEVRYDLYCHTCVYKNNPEDQEPCHDCLNESSRYFSHKPYRWKENSELTKALKKEAEKR